MTTVFARKAMLPDGWADDVRFDVGAGKLRSVQANSSPGGNDVVLGCVLPGLVNAHSHAFQRALAGHTEQRSPAGKDSFWTWRQRMYALAATIDADALYAIARQAYTEMLTAGFVAVTEFHYLHGEQGMFDALDRAAVDSGIRLTYTPVLYERAGFDEPRPEGHQVLFALSPDQFMAHYEATRHAAGETTNVAIGAHSLRAVSNESLAEIARVAARDGVALHVHVAEQQREVDQCMAAYGRRPVRWLLENFDVGENWCLVHATHMDYDEVRQLAATGAVACLCPSTEANLGDGIFRLPEFLDAGGRIAIGSDSHVSINPFEELRWLEYGQRLSMQARNVASRHDGHVGRELYTRALEGGAQASNGQGAGLRAGAPADFVAFYDDDPMLLGHGDDSRLDALVFSGYRLPVERVMVNGSWCVVDGEHVSRDEARDTFAATLAAIGGVAS
ncbi:MAG: formimidoylglutamate deiminase [Woeseiaceae bacterium]|nr:formimidoylglutamate deiminase [Woeseiaceae bacterium]